MHSKVCACARVWCATRQVQNGDPPTKSWVGTGLVWSISINFLSLVHAVLIQETAGQLLFLLQWRTLKILHIFGLTWPSSSHGPSCGQWVAQEVRLQLHSRKHSMKHIILHHPEHATLTVVLLFGENPGQKNLRPTGTIWQCRTREPLRHWQSSWIELN